MATKGQINTNTTDDSYFWVRWEVAEQSSADNTTKLAWSCGVYCGHSYYLNAIKMSAFQINGTQVYGGGTYSNFTKGEHQLTWGTLVIPHNADGTKQFVISAFTGWLYDDNYYSSAGGSYELPQIPRKATITATADFTDQENPSISFNNPGGFKMDVWLEPNPVGDHLCVRENIPNIGNYTWTLTAEERDELRNKCPGKNCTIRIGLYSYVGNTRYADYKDKKFIMTENEATKPTVSMTLSPVNTLDAPFDNMYIQGKSKVKAELTIATKYGAKVEASMITVEGLNYNDPYESAVLTNPGLQSVKATVRDNRKIYGTSYENINVFDYSKPLVVPIGSENAIQCYRSDGAGTKTDNSDLVWIKAGRSWHNLGGKNTCELQARCKKATEAWNKDHVWKTLLTSDATTDSYNDIYDPGYDFALDTSYTIQIMAIDDIGEYDIKTLEIPTRDVALHLGKGGKNVAVGTYCDYSEEYTFYSDWKAIFDKDVVVGGNILIGENKMTLRDYILSIMNGG